MHGTVLLICNDPPLSEDVSTALKDEYHVVAAHDEFDAVRVLLHTDPDLILLDLPRSVGSPDVCKTIKQYSHVTAAPIILLVDFCSLHLVPDEALALVIDCMAKPMHHQLLRLRLRNSMALVRHSSFPPRQGEGTVSLGKEVWDLTFDSVPDLVAIIDPERTIIRVNTAMAAYAGVETHDLVGRKCFGVMHETDCPADGCNFRRAMQGETVRGRIADTARHRLFDVTIAPVRGGDGAIVGCVHVARDVTAKVRAEAYAHAGQEILRILSGSQSQREWMQQIVRLLKEVTEVDAVGIRLEDEDDFPYFCHDGFSEDFLQTENSLAVRTRDGGVCRDECGNVCLECTCGAVLCETTDPACAAYTEGGSFWTNDSHPLLDLPPEEDIRVHPRNECIHQGFASVALIPVRAKGRTVGLIQLNAYRKGCFTLEEIETLEDIAQNVGEAMLRKQAEEKLVSSERFLRTLTDQIPGMVGYWNRDLECTFANKAYMEWFGRDPKEMLGITMQELMGEELFAKNEPYIRKALRGEAQRFERILTKSNGEIGHTWGHYVPDVVDGETGGFLVLVSDVTELKRAEEEKVKLEGQLFQAQKMESIGRLAGGVAHDFNNMLGVIIGQVELSLMQIDPSDPLHEGLLRIRTAAERSANLTRQLLAFARQQPISPKVLDLNDAIAAMLKMLERLIGEDVKVVFLSQPDLWRVEVDPGQVDQLLANLCVNARDAIKDTGTITIRTANTAVDEALSKEQPELRPGEYVRLDVIDDGCGMDEQTMQNVFEPFFTTKEVGKGTGLGLATVFGIVKQNDGCITVSSSLDHGTVFSIYLPRFRETLPRPDEAGVVYTAPTGRETVMLVEDEEAILALATAMLEHHGYTVLSAGSPEEALRVAGGYRRTIHLLMTDVIMPGMNGKDLADRLLAAHPDMKCLFMSGYTSDVIAQHGVLDRSVHFIQKPFSLVEVAESVRAALDG